MIDRPDVAALLDATAKVLLRCFILGYLFLFVWIAVYLLAGEPMYRLNASLFGITQHEMNLLHFYGISFVKCCVLLFFLFPYIAIRLVLRKTTR